jgi:hypothetical protein
MPWVFVREVKGVRMQASISKGFAALSNQVSIAFQSNPEPVFRANGLQSSAFRFSGFLKFVGARAENVNALNHTNLGTRQG